VTVLFQTFEGGTAGPTLTTTNSNFDVVTTNALRAMSGVLDDPPAPHRERSRHLVSGGAESPLRSPQGSPQAPDLHFFLSGRPGSNRRPLPWQGNSGGTRYLCFYLFPLLRGPFRVSVTVVYLRLAEQKRDRPGAAPQKANYLST
jgi:hypothetical protein